MSSLSKRYHNIEFIRILFAAIIILFHIFHSNIMPFTNESPLYLHWREQIKLASFIVECFFIISGYFLFVSIETNPGTTITQYITGRFLRLWPVLAFSLIINVIFYRAKLYSTVFNILFLQCIGISFDYKGINWYVSPFFWVIIFIFAMLKTFDRKKANFILSIMVYLAYTFIINYGNGSFGRETVMIFVNLGVLRAFAGIGLGYLIGLMLKSFTEHSEPTKQKNNDIWKFIKTLIISSMEIGLFLFILLYFLKSDIGHSNHFIIVIAFSLFFICLIQKQGILSRLLDQPIWGFMGKYSYSIYLMQQIAFNILSKTLWARTDFVVNSPYLCIGISLLFSMIIGIVTYYAIEKPAIKLYYKYRQAL